MRSFYSNFLGSAPNFYKNIIIVFLIINPLVFHFYDPFYAGWLLLIEFIFTLAMSLTVYPLQSGGLLALESLLIGMTTPDHLLEEIHSNLPVLLLLIFMVSGIFFMKDLLLYVFSFLLIKCKSKIKLSILFFISSVFLSAFLDALTVVAVIITVMLNFVNIFDKNKERYNFSAKDKALFFSFIRGLSMHSAIGTAVGGVCTKVGEPQNLIIANEAGWSFLEFFLRVAPIAVPIFIFGILICFCLEKFKYMDFGVELPEKIYTCFKNHINSINKNKSSSERNNLIIQALVGLWLVFSLSLHLASVGIIGLSVIILITSFCGIIKEHELGKSFEESLPFAALLVVFFIIICVILDQKVFQPVFVKALSYSGNQMYGVFYIFNGILSVVSDNVFVGAVYISEAKKALLQNNIDSTQFNNIAVMVNVGTNIPSIATPNGQAGFLFLLTSSLSCIVNLGYIRMVLLALPYSIAFSTLAYLIISSGAFSYLTNIIMSFGLIS